MKPSQETSCNCGVITNPAIRLYIWLTTKCLLPISQHNQQRRDLARARNHEQERMQSWRLISLDQIYQDYERRRKERRVLFRRLSRHSDKRRDEESIGLRETVDRICQGSRRDIVHLDTVREAGQSASVSSRWLPMMGKYLLLLLTLFFGVTFLVIPDNFTPYSFFPFSAQKLTFQTYLYFGFEHLTLIALAYIIAREETKFKHIAWAYLIVQSAHLIDYLLTYNSIWFFIGSFPVSINTVGFGVFTVICFMFVYRVLHIDTAQLGR